jgi:hypothetical protein
MPVVPPVIRATLFWISAVMVCSCCDCKRSSPGQARDSGI